jgi:glycosyltransferase involved in cell wall biosynthesis
MRIIQIIDSLETGGAERMAVNYANALQSKIEFSGLIATRKEGSLKEQINPKVSYLFLKKTKTFDIQAVKKLFHYCKTNKINFIHAHSSSYFLAVLIKLIIPKIKIIWHDHYGNNEFLNQRKSTVLKFCKHYFCVIIAVNQTLKTWGQNVLKHKNVVYLPNFAFQNSEITKITELNGIINKKILCLANLRPQKNHKMLLNVTKIVKLKHPNWTFHLIGKDFNDAYSNNLKTKIKSDNLQNHVFIYGSKSDTEHIISQADICILTSESEGLPVALIEYGMQKKPVVCTAVGEIPNIINGKNGLLAEVNDVDGFSKHLIHLIENPVLRANMGQQFYQTIYENYSEEKVISKYLKMIVS